MCTGPWSCFAEAGGGTNTDLTWPQVQLSLQQCFIWKSMILVPPKIKALQMLCTKEFPSAQNQSGAQESRRRILPHPSSCTEISGQSPRLFFLNFILKSCYGFQWFHLLWTLPLTSVERGLYPEDSPENWNKSFSEIIQGSILPTTPNYALLYS